MENFSYKSATQIFFGKGAIKELEGLAKKYGKSALVVYGGGSIIKSGVYKAITDALDAAGVKRFDLAGVDPNPRIASVREGVRLVKEHGIDMIIGAGGGSALDCAKAISGCATVEAEPWETVMDASVLERALPMIAIPTLSATGSEYDGVCVISNPDIPLKKPMKSPVLRPAAAIMDPEYTFSVSRYQTGAGTADIFSHTLEIYFNKAEGAYVSDGFAETLLKTCLKYGKRALDDPGDYEARSNLMWAAALAINGLLACGKYPEVFGCHAMEHVLSAYYDVTHGAGLAVITPAWMDYVLSEKTVDKFAKYGVNVFGIEPSHDKFETAKKAIEKTREWLRELEMPTTLSELGITSDEHFYDMAKDAEAAGTPDAYIPLKAEDVVKIYNSVR